jgi:lantibiotic modifying enzyme
VDWEPIVTGDLARQVSDLVDEITTALASYEPDSPDLALGSAGLAIYFHEMALCRPGQGHEDRAEALLARAIKQMVEIDSPPSLFDGFVGVAWAAVQLTGDPEMTEEIDDALLPALPRWEVSDLLYGIAGNLLYGLSHPSKRPIAELVIDELEARAIRQDVGVAWTSPRMDDEPPFHEAHLNLGVAHGVPGIASALASAHAASLGGGRAAKLALDGMTWVLSRREPGGFPIASTPSSRISPWGWCYGAPGVCTAALHISHCVDDARMAATAEEILLSETGRPRQIDEVHLCHGTAGLIHIFNRAFQQTHRRAFADEARRWVTASVERVRREGVADLVLEKGAGLLYGLAGLALTFVNVCEEVEPRWDGLFGLS